MDAFKALRAILNFLENVINQKNKRDSVNSFLKFASEHRIAESGYKFNREDMHDGLKVEKLSIKNIFN